MPLGISILLFELLLALLVSFKGPRLDEDVERPSLLSVFELSVLTMLYVVQRYDAKKYHVSCI